MKAAACSESNSFTTGNPFTVFAERLGYISPEPARLNGNTFPAGSLPSAPGEKLRRSCVECSAFLLCPIVPLIYPDHASAASAQMV